MAPDIISSYWWNTHEAERWKWVLNVEQHTAYLKSINPRSLFGLAPSWNWSRGCRAPRGSQFPAASPSAESGTFVFLSITNNAQRGCGALWFPRLKTQLESCCRENILLTPTTSRVEITWKRARGWPSSRRGVFTCTLTCWSTEEHSVWCSAPCEEGSLLRWWGKNVGVLSDTGERSFPTGLRVRWRAGWSGEEKDGTKGENYSVTSRVETQTSSTVEACIWEVTVSVQRLRGGAGFGYRGGSTDGRHSGHSTQGRRRAGGGGSGGGGGGRAGEGATPPGDWGGGDKEETFIQPYKYYSY